MNGLLNRLGRDGSDVEFFLQYWWFSKRSGLPLMCLCSLPLAQDSDGLYSGGE